MSNDQDTDFKLEPEEEQGDVAGAQAKLRKLRGELKEAQGKRDEYLDGWQRCKADAINARKETLAEADRRAKRTKDAFLEELLPVLDSFDMAIGAESWSELPSGFRSGMEHVRNQLLDVLSRGDIERYGKIGEQFDPRSYEIVQEVDDTPGKPHEIVRIIRFGYRRGDTVIRPAQVIVKGA